MHQLLDGICLLASLSRWVALTHPRLPCRSLGLHHLHVAHL